MTGLTEDNPQEALRILLQRLNTKFTDHSIRNLKQHPDYPSLLSINHTLNQLQIDNLAVRGTYEQLQHEFPKPLLVHTHHDGGTYRVVDALDEEQVHFVNPRGKLEVQPKTDFLKAWSGVAVLVDEETPGEEPNYTVNKTKSLLRQLLLPGVVVALLMLVGYVFYYTNNITSPFDYLFLLTKALGTAVTVPLMVRLIDKQNPWANKLCHSSKAGSKVNCASALDAPAANFLGVFAWSEIGFLYFASLFLYLLLFPAHSNAVVAGMALLAAPYTGYSLYYQWRVARQWCWLCLAVQAVLLLELGVALVFFSTYALDPVSGESLFALGLISTIMVAGYGLLKPVLLAGKRFERELPRLSRIKYSPEVFQLLLSRSSRVDTAEIDTVQLGNPAGRHRLTVVSSPICGPCIRTHHRLLEILKNKEEVSLEEVFLTSDAESSDAHRIAVRMLALYQEADKTTAKRAITDYYQVGRDRTNFSEWIQKYDQPDSRENKAKQILEQHIIWCQEKSIAETPTIFYNGYKLPPEYTIEDLEYLLD